MKIHPVGDELFRADGRTDMTELTVVFLDFHENAQNRHDQTLKDEI
jgi:hypothetical protein